MLNRMGNRGSNDRFYFLGLQNHCSHEIKRCLLLRREVMTNLESILKTKDITLLTKVHIVKGMVLPVIMYRCGSWIITKAEKWKWKSLSCIWLFFVTPWTIQSMELSRPEYWSGWPFPSPRDLPNPGIKPRSPTLQADSLPAESQEKPKDTSSAAYLPDSGIEPESLAFQADSSPTELSGKAECWRSNAFELWCWRRLLRVLACCAPWGSKESGTT